MPIWRAFTEWLRARVRAARGAPARGSLQQDVRETRAWLARAQQAGDREAVAAGVADLRALADRADAEAAEDAFQTDASRLLRELADETEAG